MAKKLKCPTCGVEMELKQDIRNETQKYWICEKCEYAISQGQLWPSIVQYLGPVIE